MIHLSQFENFDWDAFAEGKVFLCIGCAPWKEFGSDTIVGTKVSAVIVKDDTEYVRKDAADTTTNEYEKLTFKVPVAAITIPKNSIIEPIKPVAKVYGDFRNKLTITCDNIKILDENKDKAAAR